MGDNSLDFDLDLDIDIGNIFDLLSEESETREAVWQPEYEHHTQPTKQEQQQKQEDIARRNSLQMTPRVMKNDIRRYYSRMLMNTINSADFNQLQSFFSTFMAGTTKFFANYDNFDPKFRFPSQLLAGGPKLTSHYFLGIFVMYPDVVMNMNNTLITTSNTWTGTKIEMSVEFFATKMYDLADNEWIPQLETLEEKCNRLAMVKNDKLLQSSSMPSFWDHSTFAPHNDYLRREPPYYPAASVFSTGSVHGTSSSVCSSLSGTSNSTASTASTQNFVGMHYNNSDLHKRNGTGDDLEDGNAVDKRKRAKVTPLRPSVAPPKNDSGTALQPSVTSPKDNSNTTISEDYVRALNAQARIVPTPMHVRMEGTITMFLDENKRIQHMNLRVHEI